MGACLLFFGGEGDGLSRGQTQVPGGCAWTGFRERKERGLRSRFAKSGVANRKPTVECGLRPLLAIPLVPFDHAIFDINDAVGVLGDVLFMGDQDDGVALGLQAVEQRHDVGAGLRV
jgi:hypothetical protein